MKPKRLGGSERMFKYVEEIKNSTLPNNLKIIRLWVVTQFFYRHEYGEDALSVLHELITPDGVNALMYLTGYLVKGMPSQEKLIELAPDLEEYINVR